MQSRVKDAIFRSLHGNNLVYNTCWEDPRIDRKVLELDESDRVLVLTSAGCNALDYVLAGAGQVHAVDVNPRQNALLELKIAAAQELSFEQFFEMFGTGVLKDYQAIYTTKLRQHLSEEAATFWDASIKFFAGKGLHKSFYFRGSSGLFARLINFYIDLRPGLRTTLNQMFDCETIEEQSELYFGKVKNKFWSGLIRWAVDRDLTLAMLGVPRSQRIQIESQYNGGVVKFIEDCIDAVFGQLSLRDNYFWRLYVHGSYTPECCPEYLKRENFERLKLMAPERVHCHTSTVTDFLEGTQESITKFVLLDHMDWLSAHQKDALQAEWQAIINRSAPGARAIWRSGGIRVEYVDPLEVEKDGQKVKVGDLLTYDHATANRLHQRDRVHTYGSFYIADIAA